MWYDISDAFRTTQAMETIAFILLLLMPILAGVYVMSDRFRTRTIASWCMTGCFVTGNKKSLVVVLEDNFTVWYDLPSLFSWEVNMQGLLFSLTTSQE